MDNNNSKNSKVISIFFWTFSIFKPVISYVFKKYEYYLKALDNWEELNRFADSLEDKLVGYLAKENNFNKDIIYKSKTKRLKTCKNVVKKFIVWFLISAVILFIFYITPRLIDRFLPIIFDINGTLFFIVIELCNILKGFYKIIGIPIEIINIIFPALIGALIGYILTDGIDPLDNWFDKDIIDTYIIKGLEKKLAAYIDESRPTREIITCLKDENERSIITKYTYVIKQGLNDKQIYSIMNDLKKGKAEELSKDDKINIKDTLRKTIVNEYDKILDLDEIEKAVTDEHDVVGVESEENINNILSKLENDNELVKKQWKDDDSIEETRRKLYYFIDLGYQTRYKSYFALIICFTENQYTHDGKRSDCTPYIYINIAILKKELENDNCEMLKKNLRDTFFDKNKKVYYHDLTLPKLWDPFSGIKDDLGKVFLEAKEKEGKEATTKNAKTILESYKLFYGLQNFIARKSLNATQNDLDSILEAIYDNLCKVIDVISNKDEDELKDEANPPTTTKEEPKDEDSTENVSIVDKPGGNIKNTIVDIAQEWLQKNESVIHEVSDGKKPDNTNIHFTTDRLSEILFGRDIQSAPYRWYYEIVNFNGKNIRCQLCIKLSETANSNRATSEFEIFNKNCNKIKKIDKYKCQVNKKRWLSLCIADEFEINKNLPNEELKNEVITKLDSWLGNIQDFEKDIEKILKEKEQ